jgi:hypothetical protein
MREINKEVTGDPKTVIQRLRKPQQPFPFTGMDMKKHYFPY